MSLLRHSRPYDPSARAAANRLLATYLAAVAVLFAGCWLAFERYDPWRTNLANLLLVKLALIVAASAFFIRYRALRWTERNLHIARDLVGSRLELVERLASAAEYRDDDTGLHGRRIGLYATAVARRLGLDGAARDLLRHASILHDVGKIGVPDAVLLKPGPLDADERATMERHTDIGGALLSGGQDPLLEMARRIALSHHENWDGTGYPQRLTGGAIPLEARIVAVCDVFDALTNERPYKRAWSPEAAFAEIRRQSGAKFDPEVVRAFLACEGEIRAALAHDSPLFSGEGEPGAKRLGVWQPRLPGLGFEARDAADAGCRRRTAPGT